MASDSRVSRSRGVDRQPHTVTTPLRTKLHHGDRELVRWLVLVVSFGCWFGYSGDARAFSDTSFYGAYPSQLLGGGGGRYFTGSPADGYSCSVCHTAPRDYHFPLYQSGLPVDGYTPGDVYTIRLQWPEAALWAQQFGTPMTALTAELVAEGGGPSGTLEHVPTVLHRPGELCTPKEGDEGPVLAQSILQVSPGLDPVALPIDPDKNEPCTADGDGEHRCVLIVKPCGASDVQMRWQAPQKWSGTIWFAAGFVATDNKSTKPNDGDYVTELSIAINAVQDGSTYETTLAGGCNVSERSLGRAMRTTNAVGAWLMLALSAGIMRLRARRRRRQCADRDGVNVASGVVAIGAMAGLALVFCVLNVGCADIPEPDTGPSRTYSNVGLFEPTARLDSGGVVFECGHETVPGAGAAASTDKSDAAVKPGGAPQAPQKPLSGTLSITFTTTPPPSGVGGYDKDGNTPNYGVVWIEDPERRYVKSLAFWGMKYTLMTFTTFMQTRLGCKDDVVDVMAGPTIQSHITHSLTWSGANIDGDIVPQGSYVLWLELETQEEPHFPASQIPMPLGDMPWTTQIAPMPIHKDLTLTWTPKP